MQNTKVQRLILFIQEHGHDAVALPSGKIAATEEFSDGHESEVEELEPTLTAIRNWLGY